MTSPKLCVVCEKNPVRKRRKTCADPKCLREVLGGYRRGIRRGEIFTMKPETVTDRRTPEPLETWWLGQTREQFYTRIAETEAQRMRNSRFGRTLSSAISPDA